MLEQKLTKEQITKWEQFCWTPCRQPPPKWEFIGNEIQQKLNSAPGVVVWGDNLYGGIVYEGTFQCSDGGDRDWIGSVFSFQVK